MIRTLASAQEAVLTAAREFVNIGRQAIDARGRFTVALAGGSTPRSLYEKLTGDPFRSELDWSAVEFFFGDERTVPPDHEDSNFQMANHTLLEKLSVPASRIHRMQAERPDLDAAARDYQAELASIFDAPTSGEPPSLDLVLLGMGSDGHTASLFPGTPALNEKERWVVANRVPELATHRMTLTTPILNQAACVIFLVTGQGKAAALAAVLEGPVNPERLPSQAIQPKDGRLLWLVDPAAAGQLARQH